jgi:hypothetical protein
MVVFSGRGDIGRWLRTIQPAKRRREVAVALAARAALRVTPLLARKLLLPSLRATASAWAAAKYPAQHSELRVSAASANAAIDEAAAAAIDQAAGSDEAASPASYEAASAAANAAASVAGVGARVAFANIGRRLCLLRRRPCRF